MQQHNVELLVDGQNAILSLEATHWELALAFAVVLWIQKIPAPQIEMISITTWENPDD